MEICPEIAFFGPKMGQKDLRAPLGPPRMTKIIFFELPGYDNPMLGKRIFELSPIGKKLVWPYHGYGGHVGFSGPGT